MEKKTLKPGMLTGIMYRETIELEMKGETFEVEVRPLRHSEAAQVNGLLSKGVKIDGLVAKEDMSNVHVETEKMVEAQAEAQLKAAAFGTVDSCWNELTINTEWPLEWIQKVGARVMLISGVGNADEVERFRKERNGSK